MPTPKSDASSADSPGPTRRGPGRPRVGNIHPVRLPDSLREFAVRLGNGECSTGVRRALECLQRLDPTLTGQSTVALTAHAEQLGAGDPRAGAIKALFLSRTLHGLDDLPLQAADRDILSALGDGSTLEGLRTCLRLVAALGPEIVKTLDVGPVTTDSIEAHRRIGDGCLSRGLERSAQVVQTLGYETAMRLTRGA